MGTAHHNSVTFTRTASYFGRQNRHSVSCCFSRRRSVQGFAIVNLLLSPQPFLASVRRWNYLGVFDWIGLAYTTEAAFSRTNRPRPYILLLYNLHDSIIRLRSRSRLPNNQI